MEVRFLKVSTNKSIGWPTSVCYRILSSFSSGLFLSMRDEIILGRRYLSLRLKFNSGRFIS